jgi:hypothetical protein
MLNNIWTWCKQSATILWARLCVFCGAVSVLVGQGSEVLDSTFAMPGVHDALAGIGVNPRIMTAVGSVLVISHAIVEAARRRPGNGGNI